MHSDALYSSTQEKKMSSEKVITAIKEQVKLDAWQREMEER